MSGHDPRDLTSTSQSLADVVSHFDALYSLSNVPLCIRNQSRSYIYSNSSFNDFINTTPDTCLGGNSDTINIRVKLLSIELDAFMMGADISMCRTFIFNGNFHQLRIEIRQVQEQNISIWFINSMPMCKSLSDTSYKEYQMGLYDINMGLSEKNIFTLCLSVLGFETPTMARCLGVSEKAVYKRMSIIKGVVAGYFGTYDNFRLYCINRNLYVYFVRMAKKIIKDA